MTRKIRFWHYGNGPVLITIKAGQTLNHYSAYNTDEGWSAEWNRWTFDGEILQAEYGTDGTDCDGRHSSHGESFCRADRIAAGYYDEELRAHFPAWERGESGQRDYTAEAAGY